MDRYELYYQVAYYHLQEQDTRNQNLQFKASATLGFSATVVGLAGLTIERQISWLLLPATTLFVGFLIAAICSVVVLWVYKWQRRPELKELAGYLPSDQYTDEKLKEWVGDAFANSIADNERVLKDKADYLQLAMLGLVAEGTALGVILLISYF